MADEMTATSEAPADKAQTSIRVMGQYIKNLSFESPNVGKLMEGPVDSPQLQIEVNVNARQAGPTAFESVIEFEANATSKAGAPEARSGKSSGGKACSAKRERPAKIDTRPVSGP